MVDRQGVYYSGIAGTEGSGIAAFWSRAEGQKRVPEREVYLPIRHPSYQPFPGGSYTHGSSVVQDFLNAYGIFVTDMICFFFFVRIGSFCQRTSVARRNDEYVVETFESGKNCHNAAEACTRTHFLLPKMITALYSFCLCMRWLQRVISKTKRPQSNEVKYIRASRPIGLLRTERAHHLRYPALGTRYP